MSCIPGRVTYDFTSPPVKQNLSHIFIMEERKCFVPRTFFWWLCQTLWCQYWLPWWVWPAWNHFWFMNYYGNTIADCCWCNNSCEGQSKGYQNRPRRYVQETQTCLTWPIHIFWEEGSWFQLLLPYFHSWWQRICRFHQGRWHNTHRKHWPTLLSPYYSLIDWIRTSVGSYSLARPPLEHTIHSGQTLTDSRLPGGGTRLHCWALLPIFFNCSRTGGLSGWCIFFHILYSQYLVNYVDPQQVTHMSTHLRT